MDERAEGGGDGSGGLRPRTVEAYTMMLRLLVRWAGSDPAALMEERVREFFLHLWRDRQYASQSIRQARVALTSFYVEMLGLTDRVGSGVKAFEYVARYVQKTALDASRITAVDDDGVSFLWTGRQSGQDKITKLRGDEFLRRFLQHVLPRGLIHPVHPCRATPSSLSVSAALRLMRVRHFGWLIPAAKERYARVRGLLRAGEAVLRLPDKQAVCCPACGCAMKFKPASKRWEPEFRQEKCPKALPTDAPAARRSRR